MAFRALQAPAVGLPGVSGGIHYFIVCIHDDRVPINPIPHKYLIEPTGRSDTTILQASRVRSVTTTAV